MNTKFERFVTSYLVTIGAFTAADVPFVFMNRVVRDARPIELLLAQEGRSTGLLNRAHYSSEYPGCSALQLVLCVVTIFGRVFGVETARPDYWPL